ncbi:unnamed protein product [Rhizophagus irregularis]|nr:unnamed protein product [Rhizophagus irregularis]
MVNLPQNSIPKSLINSPHVYPWHGLLKYVGEGDALPRPWIFGLITLLVSITAKVERIFSEINAWVIKVTPFQDPGFLG